MSGLVGGVLPGWESKRFRPFKLGPMFGYHDLYGIEDGNYTYPNEAILRNFQKGKRAKAIWKGTLEDATHMCELLNRDQKVMEKATKGVTSDSQVRYYSNAPKKKRVVPSMSAFKSCACGAKYKGEKHCDRVS